jgi:signal transduction histidine kinase
VTDARPRLKEAPQAVREIIRRAGHEIRNALNGIAVNVEVVRSRSGSERATKDLTSFAERASAQVGEASALTDGLLALVNSLLAAMAAGTLKTSRHGAGSRIELMIYGDNTASVLSDIERLTSRVGVGIEQDDERVILTILPEGKSHSKD